MAHGRLIAVADPSEQGLGRACPPVKPSTERLTTWSAPFLRAGLLEQILERHAQPLFAFPIRSPPTLVGDTAQGDVPLDHGALEQIGERHRDGRTHPTVDLQRPVGRIHPGHHQTRGVDAVEVRVADHVVQTADVRARR